MMLAERSMREWDGGSHVHSLAERSLTETNRTALGGMGSVGNLSANQPKHKVVLADEELVMFNFRMNGPWGGNYIGPFAGEKDPKLIKVIDPETGKTPTWEVTDYDKKMAQYNEKERTPLTAVDAAAKQHDIDYAEIYRKYEYANSYSYDDKEKKKEKKFEPFTTWWMAFIQVTNEKDIELQWDYVKADAGLALSSNFNILNWLFTDKYSLTTLDGRRKFAFDLLWNPFVTATHLLLLTPLRLASLSVAGLYKVGRIIVEEFQQIWNKTTNLISSTWQGIETTAVSVWTGVKEVGRQVVDAVKSIPERIERCYEGVVNIVKSVAERIERGVGEAIEIVKDWISEVPAKEATEKNPTTRSERPKETLGTDYEKPNHNTGNGQTAIA